MQVCAVDLHWLALSASEPIHNAQTHCNGYFKTISISGCGQIQCSRSNHVTMERHLTKQI